MVSRDARREGTGDPPQEAQQALNALAQELKNLQQDVVVQLARDVARLQREKSRLVREIQALHDRQPSFSGDLFKEAMEDGSSPSFDAQQQWIRHLAQLIADRLQAQLSSAIEEPRSVDTPSVSEPPTEPRHTELDRSLSASYRHLEGDLADRRSLLSQQLRRMENLQQQGEAILTALIDRMSQDLHRSPAGVLPPPETGDRRIIPLSPPSLLDVRSTFVPSAVTSDPPSPVPPKTRSALSIRKGLLLALLSTALLALFNLSLKLIFQKSTPLGQSQWENWSGILNASWGNVLLISFLRLAIIMLLLPGMALWLYPSFWQELRQWTASRNRSLQGQVIGSGICLFFSQILVYKAIGQIPTAVAISLFFIFPVLTILGNWVLFGERPTPIRGAIGMIVLLGCLFCLPNWGVAGSDFMDGTLIAIAAGVLFTGYVLLAQLCGQKLHPIPLSFIHFSIAFILSGVGVLLTPSMFGGTVEIPGGQEWTLLGWGVGLGGLSTLSYISNTLAMRYSGATLSSLVGATVPILTAFFGWSIANESLQNNQIFGIVLVTIGAIGLSLAFSKRSPAL